MKGKKCLAKYDVARVKWKVEWVKNPQNKAYGLHYKFEWDGINSGF